MKKVLIGTLVIVGLLVVASSASAGAPEKLNWGKQVNAGQCDKVGSPVIDVSQKIINSIDSGFHGYWAYEDLNRTIQVWQTSIEDTYCAVVRYEGDFQGVEGRHEPGSDADGLLDGDEIGTFQGGYTATISNATLSDAPGWPTQGSVGTTDYECDIATADCPGAVNWLDKYFEAGYGFSYNWWGWIYNTGLYGTWVNASTGSSGNIH